MSTPEQEINCENEVIIPHSSLPEYDQALIKQTAKKYGQPVPTDVSACNDLNTKGLDKVAQPSAIDGIQKNSVERISTLRDLRNQTNPSQNTLIDTVAHSIDKILDINFSFVVVVIWVIIVSFRFWKRKKKFAYLNSIKVDNLDTKA